MGDYRQKGFTLLELMAVILIIAVLFALLLPAIASMRRAAERAHAATLEEAIVHAIKAYRAEYSEWPGQTTSTDVTYDDTTDHPIVVSGLTNNPRRLYFSEIAECVASGSFMDPWNRPFVVGIDQNNDGIVSITSTCWGATLVTNVRERVAVASWGRDPANPSYRIFSWIK
jgi:prepilin-type N-terminal cleavage/methylation domain-containing protein